ncbi:MAG TPA: glycosyltransferase family 39 protein [Verrucomicrobiae bacterium]|nr:glycosyltransferase family 39 protein [Verrucomicrobiae bacterium]
MVEKSETRNRSGWFYVLIALTLLAAVFFFSSRERLVDPDEGAYLLAAKLVMEGQSLYTDFFWPQMPLLPYAYGAWMKIFGMNWYSARALSGFLGVLMGLLLFLHVRNLTGKQSWALLAVILFAASSFSIGWFATTKTYALSTFLLFAAYLSLYADRWKDWKYLLAGVFLGLAISTRLYFVGLVPVFFYLIYRDGKKLPPLWKHITGLLLGLAPSSYFLLKNPDNFYFNNIGYHFLRSDFDFAGSLTQKIQSIPRLLGWGLTEGFIGLQFALLLLAGAYLLYISIRAGQKLPSLLVVTFVLPFMLFIPTPTHIQYFSSMIPFLIIALILLASKLMQSPGRWRTLSIIALTAYVLAWPFDYHRYTALGTAVPGVGGGRENAINWKIETLESVARTLDSNIETEGEPVLAFWPGYLLSSKAAVLPKIENHSGVVISSRLHDAQREKYRILSVTELADAIAARKTRLIIFEIWIREPLRSQLLELMRQSGYERILQIGDREIYKWNGKT